MKNIYYMPVKKENMEPLRVAAYCRVSTKKETQLASLAHQIVAYTEQISDHLFCQLFLTVFSNAHFIRLSTLSSILLFHFTQFPFG